MYAVSGYRYQSYQLPQVMLFGMYESESEAFDRLKVLLNDDPIPVPFSQSYRNTLFGVLWIHKISIGNCDMNLNQPQPS